VLRKKSALLVAPMLTLGALALTGGTALAADWWRGGEGVAAGGRGGVGGEVDHDVVPLARAGGLGLAS